jgi:hypothetical protein
MSVVRVSQPVAGFGSWSIMKLTEVKKTLLSERALEQRGQPKRYLKYRISNSTSSVCV